MMRRIGAVLAVLIALVALCARPASAASGGPTYFYGLGPSVQDPVEQETDWPFPVDQSQWVINPFHLTPCSWDVDDSWEQHAQGTLNAGKSLTVHECTIASPKCYYRTVNGLTAWWCQTAGYLGTLLTAPSPDLSVSVCYPQGRCFTPAAYYDPAAGAYKYRTCTHVSYDAGDPALVTIPGSQGGTGLIQDIVVTVTNPTGHNARNVFSEVSAVGVPQISGYGGASGCRDQSNGSTFTTEYPYTFDVS
jgi:hypothetical protein